MVGERGVTLELGELEGRFDIVDQRLEQVGQYILGVHQFGSRQVVGVPGDVCQQETSLVGGAQITCHEVTEANQPQQEASR